MFHTRFHPVFHSTKNIQRDDIDEYGRWFIHIIIHRAETTWVEEITGKPFHQKQHWPHTAWFLPLIGLKQLKPAFLKTGKCYEIRFWYFTVDALFESTSSIVDKSIADVVHFFRHFPALACSRRHTCYLSIYLWAVPFSSFCSMIILNSKKNIHGFHI